MPVPKDQHTTNLVVTRLPSGSDGDQRTSKPDHHLRGDRVSAWRWPVALPIGHTHGRPFHRRRSGCQPRGRGHHGRATIRKYGSSDSVHDEAEYVTRTTVL